MVILGLNGWTERGHDGGACIIEDGTLTYAIEEEKLLRSRYAYDKLPLESIKLILKEREINLDDVSKISIGWNYPKLYRMIQESFISKKEMSKILFGTDKYANKIEYVDHHLAHAYSTFYPSGFKEAIVLVIDGQGEFMATSVFEAHLDSEPKMKLLYETPVSLGYFYSGITRHVGFSGGQEGKTMGLAPYGNPCYLDNLQEFINIDTDGKLRCVFSVDKVSKDEEETSLKEWKKILSTIIPPNTKPIKEINTQILPYANLASSAQTLLENILTQLITTYNKQTKISNIAIAGGTGLNCSAISAIEELPFVENVFVQPAANDGGISLGSAIKSAVDLGENVKINMIPYLGPEYCDEDIEKALYASKLHYKKVDNIEHVIARLLVKQKIVANFQGRLEFGPRALGNRSLLADPRSKEMLIRLNNLKGREIWRPLAPAVLFEYQDEYFEYTNFSPYMTKTCIVVPEKQNELQAITHIDATSRLQSVSKGYNSRFYTIIKEFYKLTGIPVVINTSFNIRGKPIVCAPQDAITDAVAMNIDYLAIGNFIVKVSN